MLVLQEQDKFMKKISNLQDDNISLRKMLLMGFQSDHNKTSLQTDDSQQSKNLATLPKKVDVVSEKSTSIPIDNNSSSSGCVEKKEIEGCAQEFASKPSAGQFSPTGRLSNKMNSEFYRSASLMAESRNSSNKKGLECNVILKGIFLHPTAFWLQQREEPAQSWHQVWELFQTLQLDINFHVKKIERFAGNLYNPTPIPLRIIFHTVWSKKIFFDSLWMVSGGNFKGSLIQAQDEFKKGLRSQLRQLQQKISEMKKSGLAKKLRIFQKDEENLCICKKQNNFWEEVNFSTQSVT